MCVVTEQHAHFPLIPVRGRDLRVYRPLLTLQMLFIHCLDWTRVLGLCVLQGASGQLTTCGYEEKGRWLECRLVDSCNVSYLSWKLNRSGKVFSMLGLAVETAAAGWSPGTLRVSAPPWQAHIPTPLFGPANYPNTAFHPVWAHHSTFPLLLCN